MKHIVCYVCTANVPSEFAHEHHERPQAAGGTDKDIVFLCSGCHQNVHIIATMLSTSKAGNAEDVIRNFTVYAGNVKTQRRCMELAIEVAHWFQLKKSGHLRADPDEELEIMIKLPVRIKNALQAEGNSVRDPSTGRKAGMAKLATAIISDWVFRKYPALRQVKNTTPAKKIH